MDTDTRLQEIGDGLERAVALDIRAQRRAIRPERRAWRTGWRRRCAALAAAAAVVAVPSVAIASGLFTSPQAVAQSMPAGTTLLGNTDPTCTVVTANVEYRCTVAHPPVPYTGPTLTGQQATQLSMAPPGQAPIRGRFTPEELQQDKAYQEQQLRSWGWTPAQATAYVDHTTSGVAPGQFLGIVEGTVGADQTVNGGCRALNGDGSQWECYLGEAAVQQKIITQSDLGSNQNGPASG